MRTGWGFVLWCAGCGVFRVETPEPTEREPVDTSAPDASPVPVDTGASTNLGNTDSIGGSWTGVCELGSGYTVFGAPPYGYGYGSGPKPYTYPSDSDHTGYSVYTGTYGSGAGALGATITMELKEVDDGRVFGSARLRFDTGPYRGYELGAGVSGLRKGFDVALTYSLGPFYQATFDGTWDPVADLLRGKFAVADQGFSGTCTFTR